MRLWRPGEASTHSGDTSDHPEESETILPCTSNQRIRRILTFEYFPFSVAFTLGAISAQRPSLLNSYDLGLIHGIQNVPENLTYPLKPSRYKGAITSHIYGRFAHYCPTASFCIQLLISLILLERVELYIKLS